MQIKTLSITSKKSNLIQGSNAINNFILRRNKKVREMKESKIPNSEL